MYPLEKYLNFKNLRKIFPKPKIRILWCYKFYHLKNNLILEISRESDVVSLVGIVLAFSF
jgi:hypothetical protein